MTGDFAKSSKIRHIVRLRQMLRRWRERAACSATSWRRSQNQRIPSDVPVGYVAVCVGSSSRRFVVPAAYLNHPVFRKLLAKAEEEYGFTQPGPLSIPCDESFFEEILRHVVSSSGSTSSRHLKDFHKTAAGAGACHASFIRGGCHDSAIPLLQGFVDKSSIW